MILSESLSAGERITFSFNTPCNILFCSTFCNQTKTLTLKNSTLRFPSILSLVRAYDILNRWSLPNTWVLGYVSIGYLPNTSLLAVL